MVLKMTVLVFLLRRIMVKNSTKKKGHRPNGRHPSFDTVIKV